MDDIYLYIGLLVLLTAQIGCLFAKIVWVRLLPTLINALLIVFCIVMYVVSAFTNWGYLILLILLFALLAAMGLVWLIYGIIRLVQKQFFSCQQKILDNPLHLCYTTAGIKQKGLTGGFMSAVDLVLLYDYYGDLLTDRQKECFELRYYQDLSLGEIGEELGISRQGVHENLSRTEALLRNMEAKTGCAGRDQACRKAASTILDAANLLLSNEDPVVSALAQKIVSAAQGLEE